jgi:hypothetical protein
LAGYLLAARQGKLPEIDPDAHCQAGYIGLKSTRNNHLKHQDFQKQADDWPEVLEFWESHLRALGKRLSQGDFRPDPHPPPLKSNLRACEYCPYPLICGWRHRPSQDLEDDA